MNSNGWEYDRCLNDSFLKRMGQKENDDRMKAKKYTIYVEIKDKEIDKVIKRTYDSDDLEQILDADITEKILILYLIERNADRFSIEHFKIRREGVRE